MNYSNKMSDIIKVVSNRLGTENIMSSLPRNIDKYKWVELIQTDILKLYSTYFPHLIIYDLDVKADYNQKNDAYTINKDFIKNNNIEIIGIKGFDHRDVYNNHGFLPGGLVLAPEFYHGGMLSQCELKNPAMGLPNQLLDVAISINESGLVKDPILFDFISPSSVRITNKIHQDIVKYYSNIKIELLVVHPKSLYTLSTSQLLLFKDLCTAKIAEFLYGYLKYYDGIESGYQTIDLKLDSIQDWKDRLDSIIEKIEESYISVSNKNEDLFYFV